jgi:pimeloyl-ACP methyl ester carboxylesterase
MTAITAREERQVDEANASGRAPVVFIHGLWVLPSSWQRWEELFREAGYATLTPSWPDDPDTVEEAKANPDVFAKKSVRQIVEHTTDVIGSLERKPAVIGHSLGGLFTQMIAGRGLAAAAVAIDPAQFRGVLPLPLATVRSALPVVGNPLNLGRAVYLTLDQFKYSWANELSDEEAEEVHETYHVPGAGLPIFEAALANLNPFTDVKVDTESEQRGPLLLISGESDHSIPPALVNAAFKKHKRNTGVTEIVFVPRRGHSLTVDHGWREIAEKALAFVTRFV